MPNIAETQIVSRSQSLDSYDTTDASPRQTQTQASTATENKSEYFERITSAVEHPNLGALKAATGKAAPKGTSDTQIDIIAFNNFKQSPEFTVFTDSVTQAIETLVDTLNNNPDAQRSVRKALKTILDRVAFIAPDAPNGLQGQRIMVAEFACLQLKQVATLVKDLQSNPRADINNQRLIGKVQDFLVNISAEAEMCGPGLTGKVNSEFASFKNAQFSTSIKEPINHKRLESARQVLNDFVNENYVFPGHIPPGNAVHYVDAWQNRISESSPEYSFLPVIDLTNDPYAPTLRNDNKNYRLQSKLEAQLTDHASVLAATTNIAEGIQQNLVSNLGDRAGDINGNYNEFKGNLETTQRDYPFLEVEDFLQSDGQYGYELRSSPNNITVKLLTELAGPESPPTTLANINGVQFKQSSGVVWAETINQDTDEVNIDFDLSLDKLARFINLSDPVASANLGETLPLISQKFATSSNQDKLQFLTSKFSGFQHAGEHLVAQIKTQKDAEMFLATIIHGQPTGANSAQSSRSLSEAGFTPGATLNWNATTAPQLGIFLGDAKLDQIVKLFVAPPASANEVLTQSNSWNSPRMSLKVATAAKEQSSSRKSLGVFGKTQFERAVSLAKAEALKAGNIGSYMGLKASQSNSQSLAKLRPEVFQKALQNGDQAAALFALEHGANASGVVRRSNNNSMVSMPVSHLQLAVTSHMAPVVASLINHGADIYMPIVPQQGLRMSLLDFARNQGDAETVRTILTALVQHRDIHSMHYQLELDNLEMAQARLRR